jgi:hypothetical protein
MAARVENMWMLCTIATRKIGDIVRVSFPETVNRHMLEETIEYLLERLPICHDSCVYRITEMPATTEIKLIELDVEVTWFIMLRSTSLSQFFSLNRQCVSSIRSAPYSPILIRMYFMTPIGPPKQMVRTGDVMIYNFITVMAYWCNKIVKIMDYRDIERYIMMPDEAYFKTYEFFHLVLEICTRDRGMHKQTAMEYYKEKDIIKVMLTFCLMKAVTSIPMSIIRKLHSHLDPRSKYSPGLEIRHGIIIAMLEHYRVVCYDIDDSCCIDIEMIVAHHQQYYKYEHSLRSPLDFISKLYSMVVDRNFGDGKLAFEIVSSLIPSLSVKDRESTESGAMFTGYSKMKLVKERITNFNTFFRRITTDWEQSACRFPDLVTAITREGDPIPDEDPDSMFVNVEDCVESMEEFVSLVDGLVYADSSNHATYNPLLLVEKTDDGPEEPLECSTHGVLEPSLSPNCDPLIGGSIYQLGRYSREFVVRKPFYASSTFAILIPK